VSSRVDDAVSRAGVVDARIHLAEVSFRLGTLSPRVRVRLFRRPGSREVYFEPSHFLVVPGMATQLTPAVTSDTDEAHALALVVDSMSAALDAAVSRGLAPSDAWLVANRDY